MWYHWHKCLNHMVPIALKMTSFSSLAQDNWNEVQLNHVMLVVVGSVSHDGGGIINGTIQFLCQNDWYEVQHDFLVMCCHWHWHKRHVMLVALVMAPLHLIGQYDWNEAQHDFSAHTMVLGLMLVSYDAGITLSVSHDAYSIINGTIIFLDQDHRSEMQHDFLGHMMPYLLASASCDANGTVYGAITFLRSRQSKWDATWLFGFCDAIGIGIMWHQWHC